MREKWGWRWNIKWHRVASTVDKSCPSSSRFFGFCAFIHWPIKICLFFWNAWQTCDGIWDSEILRKNFGYLSSTTCYWERFFNKSRPCKRDLERMSHLTHQKPWGWTLSNTEMEDHSIILVLKYLTAFQFSLKDDSSILHSGKLTNVPWKETTSEGK